MTDDLPECIAERLAKGQKFNAYELANDTGWCVALGPVTSCLTIAETDNSYAADWLVDVLRARFGQAPVLAALTPPGPTR